MIGEALAPREHVVLLSPFLRVRLLRVNIDRLLTVIAILIKLAQIGHLLLDLYGLVVLNRRLLVIIIKDLSLSVLGGVKRLLVVQTVDLVV